MNNYYYVYELFEDGPNMYLILRWFKDANPNTIGEIHKPLTQLTAEEQEVLDDFYAKGGVIQSRKRS